MGDQREKEKEKKVIKSGDPKWALWESRGAKGRAYDPRAVSKKLSQKLSSRVPGDKN